MIAGKVKKLLTVGFIREVQYLEWLSSVVMVKKPSLEMGAWTSPISTKPPPKICTLSQISTAFLNQWNISHKLHSFLDAFLSYN